ncbi:type II/IV secretion system protein [Candidatus Dependentiae bacterium]|nr:type II/IV secretion system protein [Candidatus Dependentiae bacterium]
MNSFYKNHNLIPADETPKTLTVYGLDETYYLRKILEKYYRKTVDFKIIDESEFNERFLKWQNGNNILTGNYSNNDKSEINFNYRNGESELDGENFIYTSVKNILINAYNKNASDIHIEPFEEKVIIRYRIDGILFEQPSIAKEIQKNIISHIKVFANLDIAEQQKPQDGRVKINLENVEFDIRVSTIPTMHGENVVLRLLSQSEQVITIDSLGVMGTNLLAFEKLLEFTHGVVLTAGPTGSGKTTTLYAVLQKIKRPELKIATIEDPVEYEIPGINQTQINRKRNLSFANGLRSLLRQDPDIIMVGEIRDSETAEIAIQAALTGHLVLSTIHTNDTVSTLSRLVDIGLPPYLIADTVRGIISQRLVRKMCEHCKEPAPQKIKTLERLAKRSFENAVLFQGRGCDKCSGTGYKGRCGLFEILIFDLNINTMVKKGISIQEIKKYAIEKNQMITLFEDGIQKVLNGITTVSEFARVIHREK